MNGKKLSKIISLNGKTIKAAIPIFGAAMPSHIYKLAESDMRRLRLDGVKMYGIKYAGNLVGVSGYFYDDNSYWLGWTAIHPQYQGLGLGKELLSEIERRVVATTTTKTILRVMTYGHPSFIGAIAFYLKVGFQFDWVSDVRICGMKVVVLGKVLR